MPRPTPSCASWPQPQDQMSRLVELDGAAFELMFLDMMIEHHQGAIESAERVIDDGENPEVRRLANAIIAEREAERADDRLAGGVGGRVELSGAGVARVILRAPTRC